MCAAELGPFRKLVLAARRVQCPPNLEVFFLEFSLIGKVFRELGRK